jgi:hypothetical protein
MTDELTQEKFVELARIVLRHLKKACLGRTLDLSHIVIHGECEFHRDEQDRWYSMIASQTGHPGVASCRLWNSGDFVVSASTAVECATMIMRALYVSIFQEAPVLVGDKSLRWPEELSDAIDNYIDANESTLMHRVEHLEEAANPSEWLRIIGLAERELSLLQPKLLVTLDQMSKLVGGTPSVKTMHNQKATRPKPVESSPGQKERFLYLDLATWFSTFKTWPVPPTENQAREDLRRLV